LARNTELFRADARARRAATTGQNWYPLNHFRPLVDWHIDDAAEEEFTTWNPGRLVPDDQFAAPRTTGPPFAHQRRRELCAQFRRGILAVIPRLGPMLRSRGSRRIIGSTPMRLATLASGPHSNNSTAPSGGSCMSTPEHDGTWESSRSAGNRTTATSTRTEPGRRLAQCRGNRPCHSGRRFPPGHANDGRRHERVLSGIGRCGGRAPPG